MVLGHCEGLSILDFNKDCFVYLFVFDIRKALESLEIDLSNLPVYIID